jgi:hypothetical protein
LAKKSLSTTTPSLVIPLIWYLLSSLTFAGTKNPVSPPSPYSTLYLILSGLNSLRIFTIPSYGSVSLSFQYAALAK